MTCNPYTPPKRIVNILHSYLHCPPEVLIFEGQGQGERHRSALYWGAMINCNSTNPPCMKCSVCKSIMKETHPDIYLLGREGGNIKKEDVEIIKKNMPERPSEAKYRLFIFLRGENLTPAASNFLLKSMEEPIDGNLFTILTPHRALLLPTILSRGHVISLGWRVFSLEEEEDEVKRAVEIVTNFLDTNKGLFALTEKKLDRDLIRKVISSLTRRLLFSLYSSPYSKIQDRLVNILREKGLSPEKYWKISLLLLRAEEMLEFNIRPSTILEWLCINMSCTIKD